LTDSTNFGIRINLKASIHISNMVYYQTLRQSEYSGSHSGSTKHLIETTHSICPAL